MSAAIQFNNVSLSYGVKDDAVEVLKGIDFSVDSEEVISIVGPSGSGKTSIIMLASGLETASKGSIKINNQEIVGLKESELSEVRRKNIGIVFQSFYLIPNLTAVENVLYLLKLINNIILKKMQRHFLENLDCPIDFIIYLVSSLVENNKESPLPGL